MSYRTYGLHVAKNVMRVSKVSSVDKFSRCCGGYHVNILIWKADSKAPAFQALSFS